MSEIISVLTVQNIAARIENQVFTVNNAVNSVNIGTAVLIPPGNLPYLRGQNVDPADGLGYRYFQAGDSIRILSAGVALPYGFSKGLTGFYLNFHAFDDTDVELGAQAPSLYQGDYCIPYENAEIAFDVFCPYPYVVLGRKFCLVARILNSTQDSSSFTFGTVSMVGVPASIVNGTVLNAVPFVKVLHNLPLVAA
jgi:hypothetical protein